MWISLATRTIVSIHRKINKATIHPTIYPVDDPNSDHRASAIERSVSAKRGGTLAYLGFADRNKFFVLFQGIE